MANYKEIGWYRIANGTIAASLTDGPSTAGGMMLVINGMNGNLLEQIYYQGDGVGIYRRRIGKTDSTINTNWCRNDNYGTTSLSGLASALKPYLDAL